MILLFLVPHAGRQGQISMTQDFFFIYARIFYIRKQQLGFFSGNSWEERNVTKKNTKKEY
jgi:hypothetical protein